MTFSRNVTIIFHPFILVERLVMLRKINPEVAVVALNQLGCFFWPQAICVQVLRRIRKAQVFDQGFSMGAEGTTFRDHRAQVQPVRKRRKPGSTSLMPIRSFQLGKPKPEAISRINDRETRESW